MMLSKGWLHSRKPTQCPDKHLEQKANVVSASRRELAEVDVVALAKEEVVIQHLNSKSTQLPTYMKISLRQRKLQ